MRSTELEPVPRLCQHDSIDTLFEVAVEAAQQVQDLVELPLALYAGQEGTVQAAHVVALLREVRCTLDTVNDELRSAVRELKAREADAAQALMDRTEHSPTKKGR